jgi:MFS family permease
MRALTVGVTIANLIFGGFSPLVILLLSRQLGLSAGVIGVLVATGGIGGIVGALVAGPIANRIGDARLLWASTALALPCLFMVPLASRGLGLTWYVIGSIGEAACIAAFNVSARAAMQRTSPPSMLGRITASVRVFSRGALPVGALVGGAIAAATSPRSALLAMLALYAIVPLWLWASPIGRARHMGDLVPAGATA